MTTLRLRLALLFASALGLVGCDDEPAPTAAEPAAEPAAESAPDEAPPEPPDPNEACASVIVSAWQGALAAADTVTRSEDEARARAEEHRSRLEGGADLAELARAESDAASSGPRGGLLGTYVRADWPPVHEPIADAVFALHVGETSEVVRAPYGFVVARRCPVDKVHTRHILIRFAGARNAGDTTRTEAEAQALADDLFAQLGEDGADFAAMAREHSEDGSAERGGDVGTLGRGRLAPEYEAVAYELDENEVGGPVRSAFGFHIIERLPE